MKNDDAPRKWKLKLTVELAPGAWMERDVAEWKRGAEVTSHLSA